MTKSQIFFKVILLQVIKRIIPPMSNEVITLAKDTSLARIIGLAEIIMCAERFTKQGLIWPLFSTGLFFLVFNGILTVLLGWVEKKMDYFRV
ncbi:MAG: amino acid ABC transporter permease, partial [Lachnospiraceae bacterium]|nr:amino acid ABC transporter permease [Lachnospiraceae bacterium]